MRRWIRAGALAVAVTSTLMASTAGTAPATTAERVWSYNRLMERIDRSRIHLAGATYRIDATLVVCNGVGRPVIRKGIRRWHRFACTQSVFRRGSLRDVSFAVAVLDRRRFVIVHPRYGP